VDSVRRIEETTKRPFVPGLAGVVLLIATMFVPAGRDPVRDAMGDGRHVFSLVELAGANPNEHTGMELVASVLPFDGLGECLFLGLAAAIGALVLFMGLARWLFLLALVTAVAISYVYLATERNMEEFADALTGDAGPVQMSAWFSPVVMITAVLACAALLAASIVGGRAQPARTKKTPDDVF